MTRKCQCGAKCWVANILEDDADRAQEFGPCNGNIQVTEEHPGEYLHFCEKHGTIDDFYEK
jgi:hypothetical protein